MLATSKCNTRLVGDRSTPRSGGVSISTSIQAATSGRTGHSNPSTCSLRPNYSFSPLQPVRMQNLHAIRTRTGSIRSEFKAAKGQRVFVLTVHMSNRAEGIQTLAWVSPT